MGKVSWSDPSCGICHSSQKRRSKSVPAHHSEPVTVNAQDQNPLTHAPSRENPGPKNIRRVFSHSSYSSYFLKFPAGRVKKKRDAQNPLTHRDAVYIAPLMKRGLRLEAVLKSISASS
jgi:hypothetical protein